MVPDISVNTAIQASITVCLVVRYFVQEACVRSPSVRPGRNAEIGTLDDLPTLEDRIVAAIRQVIRAVDIHSRSLMEQCGLTGPQLASLQAAARLGPVSAGSLSRAVHLGQPTVSGILSRLEKRGLVTRTRGEADRRQVHVEVTAAGRALLDHAPSLLQDRFRDELQRLDDWERLLTLSVLQRVALMMGAETLDAAPHLVTGSALGPEATPLGPADGTTPGHADLGPADGSRDPTGTPSPLDSLPESLLPDAAPPEGAPAVWPWRRGDLDGPSLG